jgi:hypothetical protein
MLICRTRNVSNEGCLLDTVQLLDPGTRLDMAVMDPDTGEAIELAAEVVRCVPAGADGIGRGIGVRLVQPPPSWQELVARQQRGRHTTQSPVRLTILVAGTDEQRRGALALYVTSGWDVRFATDLRGVEEALKSVAVDAVVAEHALADSRWKSVMEAARRLQPEARRIIRTPLKGRAAPRSGGRDELFHRVVDREAGLDALLDALTANFDAPAHPSEEYV